TNAAKGPASYFPSIEKKYGRPIAEWKDLIRTSPLTRHMELVTWLKTEHGLGHGHANALVAHTLAEDSATGELGWRHDPCHGRPAPPDPIGHSMSGRGRGPLPSVVSVIKEGHRSAGPPQPDPGAHRGPPRPAGRRRRTGTPRGHLGAPPAPDVLRARGHAAVGVRTAPQAHLRGGRGARGPGIAAGHRGALRLRLRRGVRPGV